MENPENSAPEVTAEITVTGLQSSEVNTPSAETQPEIVVIETTIEQTPESATSWQERMESTLRENLRAHQDQTAQMIQTVQQLRETMTQILDCQGRMEQALTRLIQQQPNSQAETTEQKSEAAPATETTTMEAAPETAQPAAEKVESTRKKRKRI